MSDRTVGYILMHPMLTIRTSTHGICAALHSALHLHSHWEQNQLTCDFWCTTDGITQWSFGIGDYSLVDIPTLSCLPFPWISLSLCLVNCQNIMVILLILRRGVVLLSLCVNVIEKNTMWKKNGTLAESNFCAPLKGTLVRELARIPTRAMNQLLQNLFLTETWLCGSILLNLLGSLLSKYAYVKVAHVLLYLHEA